MSFTTYVGDFLLEGEVQPAQVDAHLATGKYKSWLCLNSVADGETKCPKARVEAAGIPFDSIPMGPPNWADKEGAEKILAKVAAMEKPAVIQCSTATRASAVLCAHLARKAKLDKDGALALASELGLKVGAGPPPAQAWVAMCLE
uniref:Phosphatase n=1 Tax=Pyramimonas obovata TaxID=1411642 RepID=A0A7S0R6I6_9CHLO|mmetsp:Transcript_26987/g.58901  ORF Transcript_26987/g.58901 Transcript_26987/m.58901 type:complete len:145 (+) Transcript_26987:131-565(+)|eukprot:CAMPEP_0118923210 /NCGR_PEP_ID=MMETSP1169-20130426/1821_1 /TAXON_ID=36882 /ORGANISM="Pyramimonas obovata, Strain CCMP722" /LENGTH=144 /DNA_ID=CAMNT_0006864167 /DNA_START=100 /DNA_END=534 /DNA_ORIENTATION=-